MKHLVTTDSDTLFFLAQAQARAYRGEQALKPSEPVVRAKDGLVTRASAKLVEDACCLTPVAPTGTGPP